MLRRFGPIAFSFVLATFVAGTARGQDYALTVQPQALTIAAGQSGQVAVGLVASGGFSYVVGVNLPVVPDVTFTPSVFGILPGQIVFVIIDVAPGAAPRTVPVVLAGNCPGFPNHDVTFQLTIVTGTPFGPLPEIDRIAPGSILQGTRAEQLVIAGRNFAAGAIAFAEEPLLRIERTEILRDGEARVTVSASREIVPGGYGIGIRNPDGGESAQLGMVIVRPPGSVAAPRGLSVASIVYPAEGAILASGKSMHPRGLLSATGTGTIIGVWRIDGVPFDQFSLDVAGGQPVPIEGTVAIPEMPWGEHALELVLEDPALGIVASVQVIAARTSATGITIFAPANGAFADASTRFRWSLVPGAQSYEIELAEADDRGRPGENIHRFERVTAEWTATKSEWDAIGRGPRLWRVRAVFPGGVRSAPAEWRRVIFGRQGAAMRSRRGPPPGIELVRSGAQTSGAPSTSAKNTPSSSVKYLLNPMLTAEWQEGGTSGGLQLSTMSDRVAPAGTSQWTGDLVFRGNLDPSQFAQVSRNWLAQGVLRRRVSIGATAGLSVPAFTAGAELLVTGLARPSVTARAIHRYGSISLYTPFDDGSPTSMLSSGVATHAFAIESAAGKESWAKLIGLRTEEKAGALQSRSRLDSFGILGNWKLTRKLTILYEAARGELEGSSSSRAGNAWRLGLTGSSALFRYGVVLRHTGATFVNSANRGITWGGLSDRTSADLSLSRSTKSRSMNAVVRLIENGRSSQSTSPNASHASATLRLSQSLRNGRRLILLSNASRDESDGDSARFLPETERTKKGLDVTLEETIGGALRLAQTLGYQTTRDRAGRTGGQDASTLKLTADGQLSPKIAVTALGSFIRNDAGNAGTTDQLLISLQPRFSMPSSPFSMSPQLQYRRSENNLRDTTNETQQFQTILLWAHPESILSAQLAAHWTRTENAYAASRSTSTDRGAQLAITLSWSRASGM